MNRYTLRQSLILFVTALVWGVAFVAQSAGMEYVEPFTYIAARSFLGGLVLLPYLFVVDRRTRNRAEKTQVSEPEREDTAENVKQKRKTLTLGGLCCGVVLFTASSFQQFGIQYTTVGKAGFITAMYILLVPIIGIFLHKRAGIKVWIGVALAVSGLYLLCMKDGLKLELGDSLVLACAFVFAIHILVIDYFSPKVDGVKMACIQFWICGILALFGALLFETPKPGRILAAWLPIAYAGVMSSGVGYTLQIVGQKGMNPTVASLIMSLESVVAAVAGFFLLDQRMSGRELLGCILMFAAIVLAQLPNCKQKSIIFLLKSIKHWYARVSYSIKNRKGKR